MASSSISQPRCVFVGNIPYDATEEQLIQICEEVGPVVSFRLVTDRETGKPKGYGFCEYKDEETALSARRNLMGYEINGRQLRVDFAENDKGSDKNREQGRGGPGTTSNGDPQKPVGAPALLVDSAHLQPIGLSLATAAASIMAGALGGAQTSSNSNSSVMYNQAGFGVDPLTLHLAKMSRAQLNDIFSELKGMSLEDKDLARKLLVANPLLSKALFQAQIMLGMVTPEMMANIQHGGSLLHHVSENSQHGLPPIAQNKMQYGMLAKVQAGHTSAVPPHVMSQVPMPNVAPVQYQQPQFPAQSGVSMLPSNVLKPLTGFSVIPQITSSAPSNLNQQPQVPSLQHPGSYETENLGHDRQSINPNEAFPRLIRPPISDHSIKAQSFSSMMSNVPASRRNNSDRLDQATIDANSVQRTSNYSMLTPGLSKRPAVVHDISEPFDRPSKLVKLNGHTDNGSGPSQVLGLESSVNHILKPQQPEQLISQAQLPPDVESALLQQVMNLTPEQLSLLPPDQKQQVLHLQQMLR